jgi:hypothetical protein
MAAGTLAKKVNEGDFIKAPNQLSKHYFTGN